MTFQEFILLLHVLGACIVVGVVFFSLVLVFKKELNPDSAGTIKFIRRFGTVAVGWQLITGLILAMAESDKFFTSPVFWIKLALVAVDGFLAQAIIGRKLSDVINGSSTRGLKAGVLASALVILTVVVLGFLLTLDH